MRTLNTIQRIAKNTIVLLTANAVNMVLAFFYMAYTARYLGVHGFGVLSFALAIAAIFGIFADFGLNTLTTREVARNKSLAGRYIGNLSSLKIILSVGTFGVMAIAITLLGYPEQTIKVVYLIALSVIFSAFTGLFNSVFQAFEKMEYQSMGQILNSILMFIGTVFAISQSFTVIGFAYVYFVVNGLSLVYAAAFAFKFAKPTIEFDFSFLRSTLKEAFPFGLAIVFVTIFYWISSVMLSLMKGDDAVGLYNAAYRLVLSLSFIPGAFITAIYPMMSKFYTRSHDSLRLSYEKSFKYLAIIGVPIGVGTTILAPRFISLIFGAGYETSVVPLQILVWSSVFIFMSVPYGNLFNSLNKQVIVTKVTGICLVFNVVSNLVLIPKYGVIGASIVTVLTESLSLLLLFLQSIKTGYASSIKEFANITLNVSISSVILGLFLLRFKDLPLATVISLAVVLYLLTIFLLKVISKEDLKLLNRLFR